MIMVFRISKCCLDAHRLEFRHPKQRTVCSPKGQINLKTSQECASKSLWLRVGSTARLVLSAERPRSPNTNLQLRPIPIEYLKPIDARKLVMTSANGPLTTCTDSESRGKERSRVRKRVPEMYAAFRFGAKLIFLGLSTELAE